MEKLILVERINEEGKKISKEVPENLLSLYLNSGWRVAKPENKNEDNKIK
jgi:hypothetical protein